MTNKGYCYQIYKGGKKKRISLERYKKVYNSLVMSPGFIKDNISWQEYDPNKFTPSAIRHRSGP